MQTYDKHMMPLSIAGRVLDGYDFTNYLFIAVTLILGNTFIKDVDYNFAEAKPVLH